MFNRIHDILTKAASESGDRVAVIDYADRSYTWGDLMRATDDAEACLREFGVQPGDRVVMVLENGLSSLAFFYAISRLDAISVVINARLTEAELVRIFEHSDPSVVMFSTDVYDVAAGHAKHFSAEDVSGAFGQAALLRRPGSEPEPVFEAATEQVAVMLYTSGTTGAPKAPMLTHANMIAAARSGAKLREITSDDVCYFALPLSHVYGFVLLLTMTLAQGRMRMDARFDVERMYDAVHDDVTFLPGVPQMHAQLFHYARKQAKDDSAFEQLRLVSSGGAPLDPAWKHEAEQYYNRAMQNGYGLTETTGGVCITYNEIGDPDVSVGPPMDNCVLKLDMNVDGANPEKGIGEILIGGAHVMKGYFRDSEQTAKAMTDDGYFRSGDLGWFDSRGFLRITGRCKELIIHSGFNVYPLEIEATLSEHPDVVYAGVVGRPIQGNEEVLAFVKIAEGSSSTEDDLKAFVKDKLAPYKRPARVIVASELPAAPTGKILKAKLIDTFADQL